MEGSIRPPLQLALRNTAPSGQEGVGTYLHNPHSSKVSPHATRPAVPKNTAVIMKFQGGELSTQEEYQQQTIGLERSASGV